ncbi:YwqG family protein [Phytomonospora sp. NPDC050363]|uniref:YwqG family protein n=1 Tax=Phytomonospora sp. NPDC050363 TaxID=3155642 RepID=UPI0033DF9982
MATSKTRPSTVAEFTAIARELLPEEHAEYWLSLLRPTVRLRHAGAGERVVGHLAGDPVLPVGEPWPLAGHGAELRHLLTLDLAALPDTGLGLPSAGLLEFFCFDDEGTDGRVLHVPPDADAAPRPSPPDLRHFAAVPLSAAVETTAPDMAHVHAYLWALCNDLDEEVWDALTEAVGTTIPPRHHLLGGYGVGVQEAPDYAPGLAPADVWTADGILPEPGLPVLLAQIDTDHEAGLGWGDMGVSYWYVDRGDLAAGRFERVEMTWSCF